jgi:outer membrane protein TolC
MNRPLPPLALIRVVPLPAALALGLAGCTAFGPPRDPPTMPSPPHYAAAIQGAQLPSAAGTAQQLAAGARPVPAWWTVFQSAPLDALVEEGLQRSPSLAAARGALRAAREQLRSEVGANLLPALKLQASPTRAADLPRERFRGRRHGLLYIRFLRHGVPGRSGARPPGPAAGL